MMMLILFPTTKKTNGASSKRMPCTLLLQESNSTPFGRNCKNIVVVVVVVVVGATVVVLDADANASEVDVVVVVVVAPPAAVVNLEADDTNPFENVLLGLSTISETLKPEAMRPDSESTV
mmetsp:Transcript_28117/g.58949  ORF Transcript_28117/g.58949 Transcript_28117/m.58949 type:complete len:120 (+) Transcript_28117:515-874(+)